MTLSIPLGRGLVAIIDEADLAKVSGREWRAQTNGPKDRRRIYAVSGNPRDPSDPLIFMHRLIANTPGDLETDHRNRNTLDNRRDNLRPCTSSQNQANRGPNRNNTSGYRGVSWCKADQCWVATIRVNYRKIWLGRFVEIEDAVAAYQAAAALYFGEFAAHVSDDASFSAGALRAGDVLGGVTCGNEPVALRAVPGAGPGTRKPGTLSAGTFGARRLRAHHGRFLPRLAGAFGLRPISAVLALVASLSLAACEPDHIGARDALREWGYTGIGVTAGPVFSRPCRWGEPFAVRFTAHDERGAPAAGWLCSSDERADDARILLDKAGAR